MAEKDRSLPKIEEIIVVEGRDDTANIRRAVSAETIETHGFGIRKETWDLLEKAYQTRGLLVFTDPDHAGEEIRKRVLARFPESKEAFLDREEARKGENIGVENASPEAIRKALEKARVKAGKPVQTGAKTGTDGPSDVDTGAADTESERPVFTIEDLRACGLAGGPAAVEKRRLLGKALGIGYGNSKAFLRKLNEYRISREEFKKALGSITK